MKVQYRAADERRWKTQFQYWSKKAVFHHAHRHMHTARDWQIYSDFQGHFWQNFNALEPCIAIQSYVAGQNSFINKFKLPSREIFFWKNRHTKPKDKKKIFNMKLGTRFDVCCRETTPHLLEMTAIARMIRVSHTNDHITSLNSGWPQKKCYSQERSVSVITTHRDQPRAYSAHNAAVHQAKSIGASATVSLVKNVQAADCQWCRNDFPRQQSLLQVLISKNWFPQIWTLAEENDKLLELHTSFVHNITALCSCAWVVANIKSSERGTGFVRL